MHKISIHSSYLLYKCWFLPAMWKSSMMENAGSSFVVKEFRMRSWDREEVYYSLLFHICLLFYTCIYIDLQRTIKSNTKSSDRTEDGIRVTFETIWCTHCNIKLRMHLHLCIHAYTYLLALTASVCTVQYGLHCLLNAHILLV